ncbi:MAG: signal peptidase I [Inquilinaceae bacterium]
MAAKKSGGVAETVRTVVYAVLIALTVRTFAFEPFNIPSGSMVPTLLVGDYLFVSKYSYGYSRYTLAFGLPLFDGRVLGGEPERGDVIVFREPSDTSVDFIKRLIGLPGDRIQVREGRLYINGTLIERERVGGLLDVNQTGRRETTRYIETLPNGRSYTIEEISDEQVMDNTTEFLVPEGHYFFMGDSRDNSQDSRRIGPVPEENLVGRAEVIWFSLEDASFWQVWKWPTSLRWNRLFTGVD